jgi:MFS family permease
MLRRLRPLMVLETSTLLSAVANGITMIAFPWLVLELTGSAAAAGAIGAITALPLALSFLFAGVIVDIVGRRRVAVVSDVLSMSSAAAVPLLAMTAGLSFTSLAVLAVAGAVFDPAGVSAREAVLPEVADHAELARERVNGIHEAVWGVGYLVGPGIGGLSLGILGAAPTYWITAAMFAVSSVTIAMLRVPGAGRPAAHERPDGVWSGAVEGVRFVWRDRALRAVALISMVIVGVWLPVEGVVLPVHFEALGEPEQLGVTIMAMSVGGVLGALLYSSRGHNWRPRRTFGWSIVLAGVAVVGMATFPPLVVLVVLAFAAGLAYGPVGPVINLVMQNRTPFRLRGRVVAMLTSAAYIAGPIGYVLVGPGVEAFGVEPVFIAVGVAVLAAGVVALALPSLRGMDDAPVA